MTEDETRIVECIGCQCELEIDADYFVELAGSTIECPQCGAEVAIPDDAAPARKALTIKGRAPASVEVDGAVCPECGEAVDSEAVICVNCGTHLTTGEQATAVDAGKKPRPKKPRPKMTPARKMVGVISVLVIIGAVGNIYMQFRSDKVAKQTRELGHLAAGSRHTEDYAGTMAHIQSGLDRCRLATNRRQALDALDYLDDQLRQVPARTQALREAMKLAKQAATPEEKRAILRRAIDENPGAENRSEARKMLDELGR